MPVTKRKGIWYVDIRTPGGQRIRRSTGTNDKQAALELHDKIKHDLWRQSKLGDKPKKLWDEACVRWIKEKGQKKSIKDDIDKIRILVSFRGMLLCDLSRDFIMDIVDELECSDSTKNRYIALIRGILNRSVKEWQWLDYAPYLTMYPEGSGRIRWLLPEEAERLIAALRPSYLADMALFTLNTGLRQRNVICLDKRQIDRHRCVAWYHSDQTKAGRALGVALNDTAMAIIERNWSNHPHRIFINSQNKPVTGIDHRTWNAALEKAEIKDFRWHDLRHTWASWLIQRGVPLAALQEMGGWKTQSMVQRYAHLAPEHLHPHAQILNNVMANIDTIWTQAAPSDTLLNCKQGSENVFNCGGKGGIRTLVTGVP